MEPPLPNVHVYLTEGFADDHVVVRVGGNTVFDEEGVTTKKLYGLAKEVAPVTVAGDVAQLRIELPERGINTQISADLSKGNHIPISLKNGRFSYSVEKRLGFM
jgi:hypothetical protein